MATTMQISETSRARLRQLAQPGATLDETLSLALDALEREHLWAEADAAAAHRASLPPEQRALIEAAEADTQRWVDSV